MSTLSNFLVPISKQFFWYCKVQTLLEKEKKNATANLIRHNFKHPADTQRLD